MTEENRQLPAGRLHLAEHERNTWVVNVEQGTDSKELKNPLFWAHIAAKLRPYDKIEVRVDDGVFYAEYLVLSSGRTWAKVKELGHYPLTSTDVSMTQAAGVEGEYETKWRGPQLKFCVMRKADGAPIKEGMKDKEEASKFLREYVRTITA